MTGTDASAPSLDVFALMRDVQDRFGWSPDDLNSVMGYLIPAAFKGFEQFGTAIPGYQQFWGRSTGTTPDPKDLAASFGNFWLAPSDASLMHFFGPEAVQSALAEQVSTLTGLQQDAIREMMPVAATLAIGQIARQFLHGEARNLLDAYLRGFARGRPKPQPTAADYFQSYTDAIQSFWGPFFASPVAVTEPEPEQKESSLPDVETYEDGDRGEQESDELGAMVSDWMAVGRDFQSSQFEALDSFFKNTSQNGEEQ